PGAAVKKELRTTEGAAPVAAYSQGLVVADSVHTSATAPFAPQPGGIAGADTVTQAPQAMRPPPPTPAAHGPAAPADAQATVHLQHLKRDFAAYNEVYKSYFTPPYPVRTTVGSELLDILVEIDFVAHKSA